MERGNLAKVGERMESYDKIKRIWEETLDDLQKAEGGNKAAGTRVRSAMQEIKNAAQEVREKILEIRDVGEQKSQ